MLGAFREQLNKEMTRKEFLQWLLAALLTIFGINNIIALLGGPSRSTSSLFRSQDSSSGFGTRKFGK